MMRDIVLLRGDKLKGPLRVGALQVWKQYYSFKDPGGGQNTVWRSELAMEYGAVTGDPVLIAEAAESIAGEIRVVEKGEGIQSDFSFHQHGARLQQLHYGGDFVKDTTRLAWQLRGTPWAFSEAKVRILADLVLEGSAWMVLATSTVPGTIDRQVSRTDGLAVGHGDLRLPATYLSVVLLARAAEFDALIARQNNQGNPLNGFRAFPKSDFTTYHRPAFSFFLKTISTRTKSSESINGENLKGQRLVSGDHYLLRDGEEYAGLPPVWDWTLLPGVTSATGDFKIQPQAFSGSVSDGASGATAMIYVADNGANGRVTAKKFWALSGDVVINLIVDLESAGSSPVRTALDQSLLRGVVTVGELGDKIHPVSDGQYDALKLRWIHHYGLAYLPIGDQPITLKLGAASGAWQSINSGGSVDNVTKRVFLPVLEHGIAPQKQGSGFAIVAAATPADAERVSRKQKWKVLRNDAGAQAVRSADGSVMVAFYEAGKLVVDGETLLSVNMPSLILMKDRVLYVTDPLRSGGEFSVEFGEHRAGLRLPRDGAPVLMVF